jgi:hypothetical protein
MERLRAALLGCLLAGGVLFGARPVTPRHRSLRPVVYATGLGGGDTPLRDLEPVWFQPLAPGTTVVTLRAQAGLPCAGRLPNLDAWCDWPEQVAAPVPVPRPRIRCIERVAGRMHPA